MRYELKTLMPIFLFPLILAIASNSVLGQTEEKNLTNTKFGLSMKYPSDWTFVVQEEDLSSQLHDDSMVAPSGVTNIGDFCPSSEIKHEPKIFDCQIDSPAYLGITAYKLKEGTTLKKLSDQRSPDSAFITTNVGNNDVKISGLPAIQVIDLVRPNSAYLDPAFFDDEESKEMNIYLVNGNVGYLLSAKADNEKYYDKYLPTFEQMIKSFHIQGVKENPTNTSLVLEIKTEPNADVVLLSQRLKIGTGGNNDIVGEVKNLGNDTAKRVRIDLTTYDNNGDVIGTDFTYTSCRYTESRSKILI